MVVILILWMQYNYLDCNIHYIHSHCCLVCNGVINAYCVISPIHPVFLLLSWLGILLGSVQPKFLCEEMGKLEIVQENPHQESQLKYQSLL